jgi:hypothetical protein
MKAWLCIFFLCKWIHLFNVTDGTRYPDEFGVYQCLRCKAISHGAPRYHNICIDKDME